MIKPKYYKRYIVTMFCIVGYSISIVIQQWGNRWHTDAFFANPEQTNAEQTIIDQSDRQYIDVQHALSQGNIAAAIASIPKENAQDFYNRGTLKTIRAYQQLASGNTTQYEEILAEASDDFDKAQAKADNPYLKGYIDHNQQVSKNINNVGTLYACFNDFSTLLKQLDTITNIIDKTVNILQEQVAYINQNTQSLNKLLGEPCVQNINNTLVQAYGSLENVHDAINKQIPIYSKTMNEYIRDPSMCFGTNIKPLTTDATQTQTQLETSRQTYSLTQAALQTRNIDILTQMCEQSQDDTLTNQKLEGSLNQLLNNLEKSIHTAQQTQEQQAQEEKILPTSQTPQYIPLTHEEENILEDIDKYNQERIQTMTKIKKQGYDPQQTLQSIFEVFYGDQSEFNIPAW